MSTTLMDRLAVKTPDQRFLYELENGFEFSPKVAQEVLATANTILGQDPATQRLRPGQIRQVIAAAAAPFGRPLRETQTVEVTWTIDAGLEDADVWQKHGREALRRVRILRLTNDEAPDQGGHPTEEDLGKALHVDLRTIKRDVAQLRQDGYLVNTRGKVKGVGRGQTHKAIIVGLYLERADYGEIARRACHSIAAIKRYIVTWGRVIFLHRRGWPPAEIAFTVGISLRQVEEYLEIYRQHDTPAYQERITEILARVSGTEPSPEDGKKGAIVL